MTRSLTAAAIGCVLIGLPARATAQEVDVRVKISPNVMTEVHRIIDKVLPDVRRELDAALREVASQTVIAGRVTGSGAFSQNRDFKAEQSQRETRTLPIGATGTLELKNMSGDITVTAGSGRDVTIEIVKVSRGRTDADAKTGLARVTVEIEQRGDRATVDTHYPDERRPPYQVSTTYNVTAPSGTRVTINSLGGNIVVKGIRGDLNAGTLGGNVTLTDAGRVLSAKSVGGSVHVTGAETEGTFEASSIGGSIAIQQVKARRISLNTVGGNIAAHDVTCDTAELGTFSGGVEFSGALSRNGRYALHTQSGTVQFTPSGSVGFDLQAQTFSGEIRTDLPLQGGSSSRAMGPRRTLKGTVGDGSATVVLTTFSGNVVVTKK